MRKIENFEVFDSLMQRPSGDLTVADWRLARFYAKKPVHAKMIVDMIDAGWEAPAAHVQRFIRFDRLDYEVARRYKKTTAFNEDDRFTSTRFLVASTQLWDDAWQPKPLFEEAHQQLRRMLFAGRMSPNLGYLDRYRELVNEVTHVQGLALLNVFYPHNRFLSDRRPGDFSPAKMAEIDAAGEVLEHEAMTQSWLRGVISDEERAAATELAPQFVRELYPHVVGAGYAAYHARVKADQNRTV